MSCDNSVRWDGWGTVTYAKLIPTEWQSDWSQTLGKNDDDEVFIKKESNIKIEMKKQNEQNEDN